LSHLGDGTKPEDARALLPGCTKTEVVVTSTLGNWQHIFHHRAENPKAQWQIRGIMKGVQGHAKSILPGVFE
jgi:thymidylate synthase ThyX